MKAVYCIVILMQIGGILSTQQDVARKNFEKLCHKNGGPRAVAEFERGAQDLKQCLETMATEWALEYRQAGDMESGFTLICNKIGTLKDCLKRFINSMKPCLKPDQYETMDFVNKLSGSAIQFMCDNTKEIQKAIKSPDTVCASIKLQSMKSCGQRFSLAGNATHNQHEIDSVEAMSTAKITFDAKGCSDLQSFQQCSVNVMNECEDKTFANLLDSMYKYTNNEIPCDNLPKSNEASLASAAYILMLITPVITMYL